MRISINVISNPISITTVVFLHKKKTRYPRKLNENSPYFGIFLLEKHQTDEKSSQNKLKFIFAIKIYQH